MSEQVTLDQLDHFWMPNGAPCFIANRDDICDVVEAMGFSIYYLFSNHQKITTNTSTTYKPTTPGAVTSTSSTTTTQTITNKPTLFKVVSNFVGRAVAISEDELPKEFVPLEENCIYSLPAIPIVLLDKLDQFFRLVYAQHGTESIVLLTFDPSCDGPEGWGVLVPEQTNTAAHCNYNAESVLALKPEHVFVVGSVHSHPEMPAYASGTDHADQADFDGVHITYGWQKSVNAGATQYHIELQLSGHNYKLTPEDVFEDFTLNKAPDQDVIEWTDKVKKAFPPSGGVTSLPSTRSQTHDLRTTQGTELGTPGSNKILSYKDNINSLNVEHDAIVVAEVYQNSIGVAVCPSCHYDLDDSDFWAGYCNICDIPIAVESSSINSIARNVEYYCRARSLSIDLPAYLWGKDNSNTEFLIRLNLSKLSDNRFYEDSELEYVTASKDTEEDIFADYDNDDWDFHPDYLVCCGERAENYATHCKCEVPVFYADFKDFEAETKNVNLYPLGSKCESCQSFYSRFCPAYKQMINDYSISSRSFDALSLSESIQPCDEYYPYKSQNYEYLDERYV